MKNAEIGEAIGILRSKLPEYLALHGRKPNQSGHFTCPTKLHNDKTPSCSILPADPGVWHCFQCGNSGTIFHAAESLEGLPSRGKDFILRTIPELTKRFGIQVDLSRLGEESEFAKRHELLCTLNEAANILVTEGTFEHAKARGWTKETCVDLGIGTIDFEKLKGLMGERGYTEQALKDADIKPQLFNTTGLTFTIRDQYGKVIGFAARNMGWTKESQQPKYINTSSHVEVFGKKVNLYNLHNVKRRSKKVIIVEGYACVVTAWQMGIKNVVACGSAIISHEQVDMLSESWINTAILALDADEAGITGTAKALDGCFGNREDIRALVLDMTSVAASDAKVKYGPERKPGHCDLDELLRIDDKALDTLKPVEPFEWRLARLDKDIDGAGVCQIMIPIIVNEPSNVLREKMSLKLAQLTGVRKVAIDRDVDAILKRAEKETKEHVEAIRTAIARKIQRAATSTLPEILEEGLTSIREVYEDVQPETKFSVNDTVRYMEETLETFETTGTGLRGLDCGFKFLNKATLGIPRACKMIGIPAQPNVGKTGLVTAVAWNTLNLNEKHDHIVLHYSIDDARDVVMARIVAMDSETPIDIVTQPKKGSKAQREAVKASWERLRWFIENKLYDVRDASQGTSLEYLERWLKYAHEQQPDKSILVILDNFHKVEGESGDLRVKFLNTSQRLHKIKNNPKLGRPTIIATMEMVKTRDREGGVFDIAETNQILYDADLVIIMNSEFVGSGEDAENFWMYRDPATGTETKQPMVKVTTEKNKISGMKGTTWMKFLALQSRFEEDPKYIPGQNV